LGSELPSKLANRLLAQLLINGAGHRGSRFLINTGSKSKFKNGKLVDQHDQPIDLPRVERELWARKGNKSTLSTLELESIKRAAKEKLRRERQKPVVTKAVREWSFDELFDWVDECPSDDSVDCDDDGSADCVDECPDNGSVDHLNDDQNGCVAVCVRVYRKGHTIITLHPPDPGDIGEPISDPRAAKSPSRGTSYPGSG
jgi:hypothetical protein